jgi:DNA-directed RNA polymerase I subunit RPA2
MAKDKSKSPQKAPTAAIATGSTKKKVVAETCPSFRRGSYPHKEDVDRLRTLTAPHVDSFNYFLDVGLTKGIQNLEPAELDLIDPKKLRNDRASIDMAEVSTLHIWFEGVKVAKPVKPTSSGGRSNRLLPRECRERKITYGGEISAKLCFKILQRRNGVKVEGRVVQIPKTFGKLPIMVMSKGCHLHGSTPKDLVRMKEEVRPVLENAKSFV